MTIVYILICVLPVVLIIAIIAAIAAAAMQTGRNGKRMYEHLKPYIDDLKAKGTRASQKTAEFSERGKRLENTFQEIQGRWTFISKTFREATSSPVVRLADFASRFAGREGES